MELGGQKAELSALWPLQSPRGTRKTFSSCSAKSRSMRDCHNSANETLWRFELPVSSKAHFVYSSPLNFLFPLWKSFSSPSCSSGVHMACHNFRPWIAILCWFQINPFLLEEKKKTVAWASPTGLVVKFSMFRFSGLGSDPWCGPTPLIC